MFQGHTLLNGVKKHRLSACSSVCSSTRSVGSWAPKSELSLYNITSLIKNSSEPYIDLWYTNLWIYHKKRTQILRRDSQIICKRALVLMKWIIRANVDLPFVSDEINRFSICLDLWLCLNISTPYLTTLPKPSTRDPSTIHHMKPQSYETIPQPMSPET